jgi:YbbR domain-containing protein
MTGTRWAKHVIRKLFLEDWGLKLLALAITLALWLGVTGLSAPTTKRFTIPLNPSISNNAEITNTLIPEVDIVVSGYKRNLDQINKNDLAATLDLTDVAPGERVVSLSPETVYVALPQGIKLIEVQPSRIPIRLEAVEEKEVEVKVQTKGNPADGFEVYISSALPPNIRVRGPASFTKKLDFVETDKIDLSGKKDEFTAKQVGVSVANPNAAVLDTVVDVYIRIGEKRVERSFTVPVSGPAGKTATFIIYAPRTLLSRIKPDAFRVEMSLGDNGAESPHVTLPPELNDVAEIRKLKLTP